MPLQSSRCPSSGHLVSLESPPSIPCPSVVSLSSHWTSWPFPPWLSLVPCLHRRAYRQPWPWRKECRKLCDYKKKLAREKQFEQYLRQGLGNAQDSEVCTPLTRTSPTNDWRPHFSYQLLASLTSLRSFLWQVSNTLPFGQGRKVN